MPVQFAGLFPKPVVVACDQPQGSSDGGAILLQTANRCLGLTAHLAACVDDPRQPGKVAHELEALVAQRVYGIACGYADANDAARLAHDPIHKLLLGRDPLAGAVLASQPTLSRFENAVDARDLYRLGATLADSVIERHRRRLQGRRVKRITIDLDPTDDPTHGAQQLTFFNSHYDTWCYLPLVAFLTFNHEPEQFLVAAVLRPGNAPAKAGALGVLRRLLVRVREAFPLARIWVRLDGGFAGPEVLTFLEAHRVAYVVAMAKNEVLCRLAERTMRQARQRSKTSGQTEHLYGEARYAAHSWHGVLRRVIFKAEVVRLADRAPKDNPRFVITNLTRSPRWIYTHVYCERGDIENRIRELHEGMEIDRTSCSTFLANQFRVLLTAAAYVLLQEVRLRAAGTKCARAQVWILRERLLKLGARVEVSVRRVVIHLPIAFPFRTSFDKIALAFGGLLR